MRMLRFPAIMVYAMTAPFTVITGVQWIGRDAFVGTVLIVCGMELLAVSAMLLWVELREDDRPAPQATTQEAT